MEIEKKAFASEMCHSRDWNSPNGDSPSQWSNGQMATIVLKWSLWIRYGRQTRHFPLLLYLYCFSLILLNLQSAYFKIDTYLLILSHVIYDVKLSHCFLFSKVFIICVFWNLNCNMNGLRHKFSLWMCFTIILPQSMGCQCYFNCSQKQLEQKFFWFHWLTGKNKFGISCLILRKLLAYTFQLNMNWIALLLWYGWPKKGV